MSGTVNIARSIFDHAVFADEPKTEREAWIWLIMEASWKPRTRRVGAVVVETQRGQLAASVRFLASAWKWTAPKVQRYLKRLEKMEMIRVQADTGVSVITVCNYDEYQPGGQASDTAAIQSRYTSDTNEKKEVIREEGKKDADASFPEPAHLPLDDIAEAVHDYNATARQSGWPEVQKMTEPRRRALRARLRDCGGNDGWRSAMVRAAGSDFLCGRVPTARGSPFIASFDFLLQQSSFNRLMEGNYDNRQAANSPSSGPHQLSRADATTLAIAVAGRARNPSNPDCF